MNMQAALRMIPRGLCQKRKLRVSTCGNATPSSTPTEVSSTKHLVLGVGAIDGKSRASCGGLSDLTASHHARASGSGSGPSLSSRVRGESVRARNSLRSRSQHGRRGYRDRTQSIHRPRASSGSGGRSGQGYDRFRFDGALARHPETMSVYSRRIPETRGGIHASDARAAVHQHRNGI